jgi:hypothetical protein
MNVLKYDSMEICRMSREINYPEKTLWSSVNNLLLLLSVLPVMDSLAFLAPPV